MFFFFWVGGYGKKHKIVVTLGSIDNIRWLLSFMGVFSVVTGVPHDQ